MAPPRKPCQICGVAPKESGAGRRYCEQCRKAKDEKLTARGVSLTQDQRTFARRQAREMNAKATPEVKWCLGCGRYLKRSMFTKNPNGVFGLAARCKPCYEPIQLDYKFRSEFSITVEQYDEILASQDGGCAICGTIPKKKRLAVDHDHDSGHIRGLLCTQCNHHVLGGAKENIEILRSAVRYLESPPAIKVIGEVVAGKHTRGRR